MAREKLVFYIVYFAIAFNGWTVPTTNLIDILGGGKAGKGNMYPNFKIFELRKAISQILLTTKAVID